MLIPDSLVPRTDSGLPDLPTPKKVGASAKRKENFEPPAWISNDIWEACLSTRRSKKRPMNAAALELLVVAIDETVRKGYDLDDVLKALITNGWQTVTSVYMDGWLKSQGRPVSTKTDNSALAAKVAAEMEQEIANAT